MPLTVRALIVGGLCPLGFGALFVKFYLVESQSLIFSTVWAWQIVKEFSGAALPFLPDRAGFQSRCGGDKDFFVVGKGVGALLCQRDRVCLSSPSRAWRVFIHLIHQHKSHWFGCQGCCRVCTGQRQVHIVKLQRQQLTVRFPESRRQRTGCSKHRLNPVF